MSHHKPVNLTIEYTGKEPFREEVRDNPTFGEIKLQAMKHFDLEVSTGSKYVLQYEGSDLDDNRHVDSLEKEKVVLQLTLTKEPVKG